MGKVTGRILGKGNSQPISNALKAELAAREEMRDDVIDTLDITPVTDLSGAHRRMLYRSVKQSLRLDADVVAWFKDAGDGCRTRINRALREYVESYSKRA